MDLMELSCSTDAHDEEKICKLSVEESEILQLIYFQSCFMVDGASIKNNSSINLPGFTLDFPDFSFTINCSFCTFRFKTFSGSKKSSVFFEFNHTQLDESGLRARTKID